MSETLFIADLHLSGDRPEISKLFFDLLQKRADRVDALYILGDLFELWIGDDDPADDKRAIVSALKQFSDSGTPLYFMRGNRDFLIGNRFAAESGATLLDDPTTIDLYGTPTLLMHGDTLCSDDHDYQAFRQQVRGPAWIEQTLALSIEERRAMIADIRQQSVAAMEEKREEIMDVNLQSVAETMTAQGVTQLIHGHTHRPAIHDLTLNAGPAQRMVLGDWYRHSSVLRCSTAGCSLELFGA